MRIRNLDTFLAVAKFESFHGAAKSMGATQPAISSRIAALEADLGVSLFSRDQGGTKLTSRGRQLLPYAKKMVHLNGEMKFQLQQALNDAGTMRIGIADTLAQLWVGPLLKSWRKEFPHVEFEVVIDISEVLTQQIEQHELDMVLMVARPSNDLLLSEHLCSYPQTWVASGAYITSQQLNDGPLDLFKLSHCSVLSFPRNTQPWQYLDNLFSTMGDARPMLHTCSTVSHLINLTQQGLGIALLPEPLAKPLQAQGDIRILNTAHDIAVPDLNFCCAWRIDDERLLPKLLAQSARDIIKIPDHAHTVQAVG